MNLDKLKTISYVGAGAMTLMADKVLAQATGSGGGGDAQEGASSISGGLSGASLTDSISLIVNMLIFIIGMAAVIMLVIGGFKYVFSQGNEKAVSSAKDTILYAIIGIVVALLAYAVVNFVLGSVLDAPTS